MSKLAPTNSSVRMDPWSFVTVSWMTAIIRKGAKQDLQGSDLPKLRSVDLAANTPDWTLHVLGTNSMSPQMAKNATMLGSMLAATWPLWIASGILNLASIAGTLGTPLVLQQIINLALAKSAVDNLAELPAGAWDSDLVTLEQINENIPGFKLLTKSSVKLAFLLLALKVVSSVTGRLHDTITTRLAFNARTVLMNAVARKSLAISPTVATEFSKGYVLNLVNVDTEAIASALELCHQLWAIPIQIFVAFGILASMLGNSVGAGLGALLASLSLLSVAIPTLIIKSVPQMNQTSDSRVKLIRDVLDGIKLLKIRSLENEFMDEIRNARARQIIWLERFIYGVVSFVVIGQVSFFSLLATYLMPTASFSLYAARGNSMSPAVVFPAFTLASISWNRVFQYLIAPDRNNVGLEPPTSDIAVQIQAGSFRYPSCPENEFLSSDSIKLSSEETAVGSQERTFTLRGIDLAIPRGQFVVIVGRVGSGKSTLLNAILGQLETVKGKISTNGRVSYCPQQPWIRTGTVEENILFGTPYNETKLKECISLTSLERDIAGMPSGVKTVLGEKGTSISGGQKTRVALARAVYSDSDIYLLDDPLSSLDARVGRAVLDNCVKTALRGKTVLLATHNHDILKEADRVIFIQNGEIMQGTHQEMMRNSAFVDFIVTLDNTKELMIAGSNAAADCHSSVPNHIMSTEALPSILATEESETGNVKWSTYKSYIKATGGFIMLAGVFVATLLQQACFVLSSMWLTWWTSNSLLNEPRDVGFWTLWYNVLAWLCLGFLVCLNLIIRYGIVKSTKSLHENGVEGVLNSPIWWFESQQIGRIMNRFTKDMNAIDRLLFPNVFQVIAGVGALLSMIVILAITSPYFLIGVIPLTVLYLYVLGLYRSTKRQLRRLESTQRSPLFSHIAESLEGVTTIAAYNKQAYFGAITTNLLDHSNSALFFKFGAEIWMLLRLEVISGFLAFALSLLSTNNSVISAQNLGLALLFTNSLTAVMNLVLQSVANLETEMVSVERLMEYAELPVEGQYILPSDPSMTEWPSAGCIEFKSVSAFYKSQPSMPALRDLSVSIKAGEKVCIVGRTGSGKSTMLGVLLRFVDMNGCVTIDGIDIESVGLRTLRKSMEVIPQDVYLFSKSIRSTLDASGCFSDDELWAALDAVGMKPYLSNMSQKLDTLIENGGSNMSLGQRQLLFFARILLSKTKIILMDEATSSVDPETESCLRRVIQETCSKTTLLAVLHRLQKSVLDDFDKVLVMDAGCMVEFDAPRVLLQNKESIFASLFHAHMSEK
ncbi:Multidrug resistance-associated protein 1 [Chytriomyces hyalinus]|nr:Multidrug resistance-associated protein 1 [Chytriomyces hyalinus]